ncbi:YheC/YheD family endospore coat-associated protein [Paenibacillus puerhi]|uniref:YheC/YheD family endospore coat-associated protein n=1 Tax=Paenibacillus puerhi TaxID=2692622 RepID=UPI00135A1B38|nr:YheC/YheD family protein [Paenibacillus puerhi]
MKRTKVKIQIQSPGTSTDGSIVAISESLVRKWKIPPHQPLQLRLGSFRQEVRVVAFGSPGTMRLSGALASRMGLTTGHQLCLQYKATSKALVLGPLIGVMVSRVYAGAPDKPFGANTAFCRELTDACKVYGAAVFFSTPDDLIAQGDSVRGWHYAGGWRKASFPLPHVLYNRLTSRKLENRPSVQQFIAHARSKQNTLLFNEKYLNKSEVFDALRQEAGLQQYLPESYLLKSFQQLKSMCAKYPTVFLKPVTGSLGKGIIRIRKEGGGYACHFANLNGARKLSYPTLSALYSALAGKIKTQRYQIQQGLNLLTVGGRPVDFRAVVQRCETGQWKVTSIVARIAGNHHFVSNIARGGTLSSVKSALARSGTPAAAGGLSKLRRASLRIAKGIEARVQGHFAELGVDLALDASGHVWLIEVNSKPSKEDNTPLSTENKIRPSVRQLVQYSRFAAKF